MPEHWRLWHLCNSALDGLTGGPAGFEPVGGQQSLQFLRSGVVLQLFEDPLRVGEWVRPWTGSILASWTGSVLAFQKYSIKILTPKD